MSRISGMPPLTNTHLVFELSTPLGYVRGTFQPSLCVELLTAKTHSLTLIQSLPDLYAVAFPKDPLRTKVVVYLIYALEVTQTILVTRSTFVAFVYGFGNMHAVDNVGLVWLSVPLLTGVGQPSQFLLPLNIFK